MTDGSAKVPAQASPSASATAAATASYARVYEEQQPRLVAYARSLTRNAWSAEDLVAEAHFRVWRRLSAGHEIDNVPAYLMTTVRHLASTAGTATRETPHDPQDPLSADRIETGGRGPCPADTRILQGAARLAVLVGQEPVEDGARIGPAIGQSRRPLQERGSELAPHR